MKKILYAILLSVLILAGASAHFVFIGRDIFDVFVVSGDAMSPTYEDGNYFLLDKIYGTPDRSDIVVIDYGTAERPYYQIKRIIGLPEEVVTISDYGNRVTVSRQNIKMIEGTYGLKTKATAQEREILHLGADQYFVLTDGGGPLDWRKNGLVMRGMIVGVAKREPLFSF